MSSTKKNFGVRPGGVPTAPPPRKYFWIALDEGFPKNSFRTAVARLSGPFGALKFSKYTNFDVFFNLNAVFLWFFVQIRFWVKVGWAKFAKIRGMRGFCPLGPGVFKTYKLGPVQNLPRENLVTSSWPVQPKKSKKAIFGHFWPFLTTFLQGRPNCGEEIFLW